MPRATWPLVRGRPVIDITLQPSGRNRQAPRVLLADTGAGSALGGMELVLSDADRHRFSLGDADRFGLETR